MWRKVVFIIGIFVILGGAVSGGFLWGWSSGYNDGNRTGSDSGYISGYRAGAEFGYTKGFGDGMTDGYKGGYAKGSAEAYDTGYKAGYDKGYNEGIKVYSSADYGYYVYPGYFYSPYSGGGESYIMQTPSPGSVSIQITGDQ